MKCVKSDAMYSPLLHSSEVSIINDTYVNSNVDELYTCTGQFRTPPNSACSSWEVASDVSNISAPSVCGNNIYWFKCFYSSYEALNCINFICFSCYITKIFTII